jgi:predicted SnoaL-like aldol condensation-catalyzing enzyme
MEDSKQIALNVLRGAFIDRDPSVVGRYFAPGYTQHNPTLPDGPGPIIELPMWRSCRADGMSAISSNE